MALFAKRGYEATGIRDIAREAGLSSSTLYWHMGTKEDLLVAIMKSGFEIMTRLGSEAIAAEDGADRQLATLVRAHVLMHTERQDLGNIVDSELRFLGDEARAVVMPMRDAYGQLWEDVVARGIEEDLFTVSDAHVARLGILEMCNGVARWYRPAGSRTADEIADLFVELVLNAVGSRKRRKPKSSAEARGSGR